MVNMFVVTQDQETAKVFTTAGLQLVQNDGNTFVFLNDIKKMQFAGIENLKFVYSNKMIMV